MPYARRRRVVRRRKPRRFVRRAIRRMRRPALRLRRAPLATMPMRKHITFKYVINFSMGESDSATTAVFSTNNCYSPHIAGGTLVTAGAVWGQPLGFDQWNSFYQRYRCYSSTCCVRPVVNAGATPCVFTLDALESTVSVLTDAEAPDIVEQPGCVSKMVTTQTPGRPLVKSWRRPREWDPASSGALFSAGPAQTAYYQLTAYSPLGVAIALQNVGAQLCIYYRCVLYDPQTMIDT